jgi:hypothetical protein
LVTRKRDRRQLAGSEDPQLEHLRSGLDLLAARHPAAKRDPDDRGRCCLGDVIEAEQLCQLDKRADLLPAFAHRGVLWFLVMVHKAAGQAPQAVAGLDGAPPENDPAVELDDHGRSDLRVAPQHEIVVGARLHIATLEETCDQW